MDFSPFLFKMCLNNHFIIMHTLCTLIDNITVGFGLFIILINMFYTLYFPYYVYIHIYAHIYKYMCVCKEFIVNSPFVSRS